VRETTGAERKGRGVGVDGWVAHEKDAFADRGGKEGRSGLEREPLKYSSESNTEVKSNIM
jgi:hypothetical protein